MTFVTRALKGTERSAYASGTEWERITAADTTVKPTVVLNLLMSTSSTVHPKARS